MKMLLTAFLKSNLNCLDSFTCKQSAYILNRNRVTLLTFVCKKHFWPSIEAKVFSPACFQHPFMYAFNSLEKRHCTTFSSSRNNLRLATCNRKNSHQYRTDTRSPIKNYTEHSTLSLNSRSRKSNVLDRYLYVKTLDRLYDDVENGIILDTAYGDSRPDDDYDPSVPVVLALHDTPGTHKDVVPLLNFFAKIGCRTICPSFPGHGDTRGIMRNYDDIFSQSTMERAIFVHDFLSNLGIQRVDTVIGVGAACYAAMALVAQNMDVYKSVALISPWPFFRPRFETDSMLVKSIHELWEMVYFRPIVRLFLPLFNVGNSVTTEDKVSACYLAQNIDFGEVDGLALTLALKDIPRFVAYGARDKLITDEIYDDMLRKLGIPSENVATEDQRTVPTDKVNQARAVVFREAGYNLLTSHRSALSTNILQLIQQFRDGI